MLELGESQKARVVSREHRPEVCSYRRVVERPALDHRLDISPVAGTVEDHLEDGKLDRAEDRYPGVLKRDAAPVPGCRSVDVRVVEEEIDGGVAPPCADLPIA